MWKKLMLSVKKTRCGGGCAARLYAQLAYKVRYLLIMQLRHILGSASVNYTMRAISKSPSIVFLSQDPSNTSLFRTASQTIRSLGKRGYRPQFFNTANLSKKVRPPKTTTFHNSTIHDIYDAYLIHGCARNEPLV